MRLHPGGPVDFEVFQKRLVSESPHSEETLTRLFARGCQRDS